MRPRRVPVHYVRRVVLLGVVIVILGFALLALIAHHPGHGLVPPRIKRMEAWAVVGCGGLLVLIGLIRYSREPTEAQAKPVDAEEFVDRAVEEAEALRDGGAR